MWIIKPGECTNRGRGIVVCSSIEEIEEYMEKKKVHKNGEIQSYIIQKYIEKPLLYQNRKFDIRCFMLLTSINGILKAYFYLEGYVRTSCHKYSVHNLSNKFMHLTNDAI